MLLAPYAFPAEYMKPDSEDLSQDIERQIDIAVRNLTLSKRRFAKSKESIRLMHQACLLIWSAFETLCKEVFILSLNERPQLFQNIQKDPELKEYFTVSQSAWLPLLESHGFDLNGKLGTIVASSKDFSSPQLLRNIFCKLYVGLPGEPVPELLEYFRSDELWKLGQRRHLIAHRCGVVDKEYLKKTSDTLQEVSTLLQLRGRDVAQGMAVVAQCATAIYYWAQFCWVTSEQLGDSENPS